jgi:single-strand DNA-binding protein
MENNTVIGNVCADPTLRMTKRSGRAMARFTVAVNQRRKIGDEFIDRPAVFHRVVCFGQLAENVSNSLHKGMEVLAVGEWVDDSYEDEHGQKHNYVAMEAKVIGAGLRWATASVSKVERPARVIPLPGQALPGQTLSGQTAPEPAAPDPDPPAERNDDREPDEFSANTQPTQPPEPAVGTTRTTRKGERRPARAS